MYFVEHGDNAVAGQTGVYDVTPYELASRLSYQLWQTAPDDALLAAAADGSLRTAAVYDAQVTRLLADARARPALDEFFADWMKVEDLPAMDAKNADATFKTFAGGDLPDAKLRQAMIDDVVGMLDYYTWTMPSAVARCARPATSSFARDARLAKLYGVAAWNGTGAPPALPAGQRPGLLTRALFLSTGTREHAADHEGRLPAHERPVRHDPAAAARRQREAARSDAGHDDARERRGDHRDAGDGLRRLPHAGDQPARVRDRGVRRARALPHGAAAVRRGGVETGTKPVNTSTVPQVVLGDTTMVSTPAELMSLMLASGKVEACLSRNFFRFTYGRWEAPATDGCALEDARKALVGGGSLRDLAAAAVKSAEFKRRAFQ